MSEDQSTKHSQGPQASQEIGYSEQIRVLMGNVLECTNDWVIRQRLPVGSTVRSLAKPSGDFPSRERPTPQIQGCVGSGCGVPMRENVENGAQGAFVIARSRKALPSSLWMISASA